MERQYLLPDWLHITFSVTESTQSIPTEVEGRAAQMQSETGWFFFSQMYQLNVCRSKLL